MALKTTLLPTGSVQPFYNGAAPVGWTKVTNNHNYTLRVVSGTAGSGRGYPMISEYFAGTGTATGAFSDATSSFSTSVNDADYNIPVKFTAGSSVITTGDVQGGTTSPPVGFSGLDPVVFNLVLYSGGVAPVGISSGTTYYIKSILTHTTFTVSTTPGGTAITITSAGSGQSQQYFTSFRMRFDDTTLTTSQIPAHYHAAYKDNGSNTNDSHQWTASGKRGTAVTTTSAGSGSAHSHTYTMPMAVYYANVIMCERS